MNTKNYKKNKTPQMKTVGKTSKPKIDKNQLLAIILAGLIIFWTVASVFGFIGYARTKKPTAKSSVISASAQTVADFVENDELTIYLFYFDGITFNATNGTNTRYITIPYIDLIISHGYIALSSGDSTAVPVQGGGNPSSSTLNVRTIVTSSTGISRATYPLEIFQVTTTFVPIEDYSTITDIQLQYGAQYVWYEDYTAFRLTLQVRIYTGADSFRSYRMFMEYNMPTTMSESEGHYFLPATDYVGSATSTYQSSMRPAYGFPSAEFLRYYYNTFGDDYDNGYENGLRDGKEAGKAQGLLQGRAEGYDEGKADGLIQGRAEGRQEGINDANVYTFDKLLSAVIDVPIRAFTSLFNFEILGIDLSLFFFSLLSLAIVLAVVRMVL